MKKDTRLTPEQRKVFANLKRAFTACEKAGIYLWDNYGSVSAVNGRVVNMISTDNRCGEFFDQDGLDYWSPENWHGSNADDSLYVDYK